MDDWLDKEKLENFQQRKSKKCYLWKAILVEKLQKSFNLEWTRGHDGNEWNELADQLCNEEMKNYVNN